MGMIYYVRNGYRLKLLLISIGCGVGIIGSGGGRAVGFLFGCGRSALAGGSELAIVLGYRRA